MESKEKNMVPPPFQTLLDASAGASHEQPSSPHHDSHTFYTKLTDLLDSSGFTLIFNVRETLLDLYLFYLEVTRRGGYHQVGREKKWGEVVFALKLEGNSVKLCAQVEKLYEHILYQYELLYFYRCPTNQAGSSSSKGPLKKKRNLIASLPPRIMDIEDGQKATGISKDLSCHMTGFVEQPVFLLPPSNDKEMKRRRGAPSGRKNAYQIFLKHECARLKTSNLASDGQRVLRMAIDAWRNMSELEKQPYVEESKKNKEEIKEAMISHNKQQSSQDTREEKWPSTLRGDYLVTSQPEANESLVNKATVGLALKMTEKAPRDPSFLMEWDGYCALDSPTRESQ
ncbi:high mobility group B protein 10 [Cajanus cajan]|uniref:high mobility group B protein 10 n=1 Tax=Cajanus cajan TaxID=3821 RepID=UPI00098D97CB|nr:high mobility group B protein 10 [Cajanus cajan]